MTRTIQGIPVSPGIAVGPTWVFQREQASIERQQVVDPGAEKARLEAALAEARTQLHGVHARALESLGPEDAAIFEAHLLFLKDPELLQNIHTVIDRQKLNAEAAVSDAIDAYTQALLELEEPYFQARAQDVRDVGNRVINCLSGIAADDSSQPAEAAIIVAEDLTPSDTMQFQRERILGICTVRGGPTGHSAILARALGIPAVVCVPVELQAVAAGAVAILDGTQGRLTLDPTEDAVAEASQRQAQWRVEWKVHLKRATEQARTRDGQTVKVVANVSSLHDARQAIQYGAEGIGLLRTEFLYLDRTTMPTEEEQIRAYRGIFAAVGSRPVVARTLDVGGDKAVSYLDIRDEPNPFLGWRAIRIARENPALLTTQLRALLQAGVETDLRVMVPMVSGLEEVEYARALLHEARANLDRESASQAKKVQFGIMVEVPSVAILAEQITPLVDFFSIGTNDLTQYTLAVDRTNDRVAALASPYHPAVLHLIAQTIHGAHAHGKWVGLCGELAGDPLAMPLLLGLGLDEFSMVPAAVPTAKHEMRRWEMKECQQVADHALSLTNTEAVRSYLKSMQPAGAG